MNHTSTRIPLWQTDCDHFRRALAPFQIRDVTTEEQEAFCRKFAEQFDLRLEKAGKTIILYPPPR